MVLKSAIRAYDVRVPVEVVTNTVCYNNCKYNNQQTQNKSDWDVAADDWYIKYGFFLKNK